MYEEIEVLFIFCHLYEVTLLIPIRLGPISWSSKDLKPLSPTPTRKIIKPTELTASPKYKTIELSEPFLKFNCKTLGNKK